MTDTVKQEKLNRGFETSDASAKHIVLFALGLSLSIILVLVVLWFVYKADMGASPTTRQRDMSAWSYTDLKVKSLIQHRHDQQQLEKRHLKRHAWIDREAGIARLPIGRALQLVSENGLPQWDQGEPPKTLKDMIDERAARN